MNDNPPPPALLHLWQDLALNPALWAHRTLPWFAEGEVIPCLADRFGRQQSMTAGTWAAWQAMEKQAAADGIRLEVISAYRSWRAQAEIWQRKRQQGLKDDEILRFSAPPGLSEHHSGRALDLAAGEHEVLTGAFARSPAYRWLRHHAHRFGFVESYPSGNPAGFQPEPWHWCWHP